jgi:hypothetical protein
MARTSIAISLILVETLREAELGRAPFVPNRLILHAYGILMTHRFRHVRPHRTRVTHGAEALLHCQPGAGGSTES